MKNMMKETTYYVKGMHCSSCEILIEKKLLENEGVTSVEASTGKGEVTIEYRGERPKAEKLSQIFRKDGYSFSDSQDEIKSGLKVKDIILVIGIGALFILGFFGLNKLGLSELVDVNSKSSLPMFFLFGLLAGISSCMALVGGLILSMSKQWLELYPDENSTLKKIQPHLMFNVGRIISYALLGSTLGAVGSALQLSLRATPILVIVVSIIMILLALQMLGVKAAQKFQLTMPRFITRSIADESRFKGRYLPMLMGALTFFLPCGFTITAQGLALISGSAIQGGLIMLFFALGTLPVLLMIGLSSVKLSQKSHYSYSGFLKFAGVLVLFFALFNINSQLNVLGFSSISDLEKKPSLSTGGKDGLPPVVDGKQVIKMNASSSGYSPNYFKVKVGIPVRWEITDIGTSGCTNAVISRELFGGQINLTPGQTSTREFTPTKVGKFKFSCWMGMISGVMEVVDGSNTKKSQDESLRTNNGSLDPVVGSGASGCCGASGGQ